MYSLLMPSEISQRKTTKLSHFNVESDKIKLKETNGHLIKSIVLTVKVEILIKKRAGTHRGKDFKDMGSVI